MPGPACSAMSNADLSRLQNQDNFNSWKQTVSAQLNSISSTTISGSTQPSLAEAAKLNTVATDIFNTTACIQEQLTLLSGTTNSIHDTQQGILDINDQILQAEADVNIARDRVAYIRHPEQHTSYYESWFPIDRPMHKENVSYFVAATVFVVMFSILVGFSLIGFDISIIIQPRLQQTVSYIISQFTWLTLFQILIMIYSIYFLKGSLF
jgi:hypothetical protein